jgi:hypothetical protein
MSFVVTVGSDVECPDQGVATIASPAKLTVSSKPVVVKDDLLNAVIAGCKQIPPPASKVTCVKVATLTSGEAAKLTVGGRAVLLDSLAAVTAGAPNNQLTCKDAKQKKLTAK